DRPPPGRPDRRRSRRHGPQRRRRAVQPLRAPAVRGAHRLRLQAPGPLHEALRGPRDLPRGAGGRRVRRRRDGPAAGARGVRPRPRHHAVHQQPWWLVHRDDGDLRHDAVHPARHPDRVPGPGRLRGGGAARRRHAGQAPGPAERAGADPPARAGRRRLRAGLRHRDPGQRGAADAHLAGGHPGLPHRPHHPAGAPRHRARQDPVGGGRARVRAGRPGAGEPQGHRAGGRL
ncbi:MAG: ATP-dependent Clp protease proteolytic subunit, partial [uncultured Quadrisphaera sp.]